MIWSFWLKISPSNGNNNNKIISPFDWRIKEELSVWINANAIIVEMLGKHMFNSR